MTKFECWQMPGHADIFDSKIYFPSSSLKRVYNNFNEFVLLNKFVPKDKDIKLLEVGCAAGEFPFPPLSASVQKIIEAGGLLEMLKK